MADADSVVIIIMVLTQHVSYFCFDSQLKIAKKNVILLSWSSLLHPDPISGDHSVGLSLDVFQLGPGFGALRALPIPTLPYQWPVTEMEVTPLQVQGVGRLGSRLVTPDALGFHILLVSWEIL